MLSYQMLQLHIKRYVETTLLVCEFLTVLFHAQQTICECHIWIFCPFNNVSIGTIWIRTGY